LHAPLADIYLNINYLRNSDWTICITRFREEADCQGVTRQGLFADDFLCGAGSLLFCIFLLSLPYEYSPLQR
jgi:hypothetical protein